MTRRQELVFLWLIAINAVLLLVAPIGAATILQPVIAIFTGR